MIFKKFYSDEEFTSSSQGLIDMIDSTNHGTPHTEVFKKRVKGELADICHDAFYIAEKDGECVSRLWNGWGRHNDSVGNFGDFHTLDDFRGQGLGGKLLDLWYEDLMATADKPIGLFCTSAQMIAKAYEKYGMKGIFAERIGGPSYMPLGDSPEKFSDLCDLYYTKSDTLIRKKATFEFRHEIDLLLKFTFMMMGIDFGIGDIPSLEWALLFKNDVTSLYFSQNGHCVGWSVDDQIQLHPLYKKSDILQ